MDANGQRVPRSRPLRFKPRGFFVQWIEWLQRQWPRSKISFTNLGRSAESLHTLRPCLLSMLPSNVDLIVLESTAAAAGWVDSPVFRRATESVLRALLAVHSPPPSVVWLNVPLWTSVNTTSKECGNQWHVAGARQPGVSLGVARKAELVTPQGMAEHFIKRLCYHYDVACVSYYDALQPLVAQEQAGFALADVAADCLHPDSGRHGARYMTDLLVHYVAVGAMRYSGSHRGAFDHRPAAVAEGLDANAGSSSEIRLAAATAAVHSLPWVEEGYRRPMRAASCFRFQGAVGYFTDTQWLTAGCSESPGSKSPGGESSGGGSPGGGSAGGGSPGGGCEAAWHRGAQVRECPFGVPPATIAPQLRSEWIACGYAGERRAPGIVAFAPGARLRLQIPLAEDGARFSVHLLYLRSYEHMGEVALRCQSHCACGEQRINAHAAMSFRNASTVESHVFDADRVSLSAAGASVERSRPGSAWLANATCVLELRVLSESRSGEHTFKAIGVDFEYYG